jgi:hypothetical protein
MTVLIDTPRALEERGEPVASKESMQAVLSAIRRDLPVDPAKTESR